MERIVIVSNRVPSGSSDAAAGGLTVALKAALGEREGIWFGWDGKIGKNTSRSAQLKRSDSLTFATLSLSNPEFRGYYEEFSNRALWPVFHGRLDLCRPDGGSFQTYKDVNLRFARALTELLQKDDRIWVQDYHLIPLGRALRRLGVEGPLGFFLHIPFPQAESLAALPSLKELLADLCAYDLVGFQTQACADNFRDAVTRTLGGCQCSDSSLTVGDQVVTVGAFPVGLDTRAFAEMAASPEVLRRSRKLRDAMGEGNWICGVDRLDYIKGIAERLRAFESLLHQASELRGRLSLIQVAAPSRESVAEYRAMRDRLDSISGRINGRFGTFDWTPVHYLNRTFSQKPLAALYRASRIGLVTPLRDGMNLVAKEYVAAQDPEDPGVLVLSRFAGAAEELSDALLVNPYDQTAVVEAIKTALAMPLAERQQRWRRMFERIEQNTAEAWRNGFLEALESAWEDRSEARAERAA